MTTTLPDVAAEVIGALVEAVDDEAVTIDDERPATAHTGLHVQVGVDGGTIVWPIVARPLVRITTWAPAGKKAEAMDLAFLCLTKLLSEISTDVLAGFYEPTVPVADKDDETGDEFATFTVNANVRTVTS